MAQARAALARVALALAVVGLGAWSAAVGGESPSSGPPVGGRTPAFNVQDVTGPAKGSRLCYI